MQYSFDVNEAKEYGVNEAIIIYNLRFWILKNKANNHHEYEGRTWTYNQIDAFAKLFPFWKSLKIWRILDSMVQKKVIIKGNFNQNKHDRTIWYAFNNEEKMLSSGLIISHFSKMKNGDFKNEKSNFQNRKMEISEMKNDNKETDIKPNIKPFSFVKFSEKEKKEKLKDFWKKNQFKSDWEEYFYYHETRDWEGIKKWEASCHSWEKKYLKHNPEAYKLSTTLNSIAQQESEKPIEKIQIDNDHPRWQEIKQTLKNKFPNEIYNKWLQKLNFVSCDGKIKLATASKFIRDWIRREYLAKMQDVLKSEISIIFLEGDYLFISKGENML